METFIDGGSLNLYTSEDFIDWCNGEVENIYAFEVDDRCLGICNEKIKKDKYLESKIKIINKGLWSKETKLLLDIRPTLGASHLIDSPKEGDIEVTSIDKCVGNSDVTFIKMDIEGSELEALKGAESTIIRNISYI